MIAFNPILVWFYRENNKLVVNYTEFALSIPFWSDFIPDRQPSFTYNKKNFQSHFGLILSEYDANSPYGVSKTFNPILVWFYLLAKYNALRQGMSLSIPFWSDFIADVNELLPVVRIPFNPILVWFYLVISTTRQTRHS